MILYFYVPRIPRSSRSSMGGVGRVAWNAIDYSITTACYKKSRKKERRTGVVSAMLKAAVAVFPIGDTNSQRSCVSCVHARTRARFVL